MLFAGKAASTWGFEVPTHWDLWISIFAHQKFVYKGWSNGPKSEQTVDMQDKQSMTAIPPDLVDAYRNTDFTVIEPFPFTLRIGNHSTELTEVYKNMGVSSAGYLTAWNPYSLENTAEDNAAAQLFLIQSLSLEGYPTLRALGVDPSGEWPGEESVFVPGLDLERAKSLGIKFGQNAIVWADSDAVPQLVLLR